MSEAAVDDLPTDPPRSKAKRDKTHRPGWLPWWLPLWVLVVCSVGVVVIGLGMALVLKLPA